MLQYPHKSNLKGYQMTCEKFNNLAHQVRIECESIGATEKTVRYLINKASRVIKKAKHDIYYGCVSIGGPNYMGMPHTRHYKIKFHGGVLFINVVVD